MPTCWVLRIYEPRVCSCTGKETNFNAYYPYINRDDIALLYIKNDHGKVEPLCYARISYKEAYSFFSETRIIFSGCKAIDDPYGRVKQFVEKYSRFDDIAKVDCDEMLKVVEEAKSSPYIQTPQNEPSTLNQPMPIIPNQYQNLPQAQYYPTNVGIIKSDGTVRLSLYAPSNGKIVSATIQGTSLTSININPAVLNPGNNDITLYFGNVDSLQVGQQYVVTLVIHTGSNFYLVNAIAIYQG
ncbi:DUF973 family protein (plasmid) [Sulfolobus tengchongensis]|uniref:DUF973 family protein n=1 Tax=Sulfolobus tengchongensis TaxID=207809 RepID=A0AAX4L4D4_9CREN